MIKLKTSFSKKVPASTEYSSQSYHCEIECEVPDGLTQAQLQQKVHDTFEFVRNAVEKELNGSATATSPTATQSTAPQSAPISSYGNNNNGSAHATANNNLASAKQINYLLSLSKRNGWSLDKLLSHCHIEALEQITSRDCSNLIKLFTNAAA